jgi:4-diphosphocytidyl-2-C-methyl-D-erythritol kinase
MCTFALGWGRGERLLALPSPAERELLLVLPPFAVNTAEAYRWLAAARETGGHAADVAGVLDPAALVDWSMIARMAINDFEPVVAARHPLVATLVAQLHALGCAPAMMSGSGSSLFGVLPQGARIEVPRFEGEHGAPAPRVLLTRTATGVAPVVPVA